MESVVLWNTIPYYLGTSTKIAVHTDQDIEDCSQLMAKLLDLPASVAVRDPRRQGSQEDVENVTPLPQLSI